MKVSILLEALINVAEKGANIARIIRSESSLLELLVEEKKGEQKNDRFLKDFKTLADVLVQEVVRYDLKNKFPGIKESIYGEESNKFTNTLGDSVVVEIQDTPEETRNLLRKVLDDNEKAAHILSKVIHQDVAVSNTSKVPDIDLAIENIGVWIDPIDSTAQYIQGDVGNEVDGLVNEGLQCVAVLIGVYHKSTGLPLIGVTNQPFYKLQDSRWSSNITWGVCIGDTKINSLEESSTSENESEKTVLISSSESDEVKDKLGKCVTLRDISGAGYKLLGVCQGRAEAYLLTKSSNYKWDCCGPHAILLSLDGGIIKYSDFYNHVKSGQNDFRGIEQVKYHVPDDASSSGAQKWCNQGGIIAYRTSQILKRIAEAVGEM
ncbi:inositol polyphosphate 1-phosphatase-like [Ruditapes philippinarum]|uniref:inositol polyphosphate 1-phosphatase-like n=1 Tax=Ruditapes philippinarum TaxID=129788 RepID=UPI00295B5E51|nr:inositol polyphosphate 1-phosphatase-like [Ruditapes philippinarum]XP_060566494.1 inositol polyphosphate 1-phosphatase-like [Ruditapes philippinarum]XP_060566495.1 inositol polyphosphate 1-phosphatase-like [Ruditapes philippinarum]XP_060566496.1 inositol polyphosphate 1-phosphatase-like [Ruditapes philippinarum]